MFSSMQMLYLEGNFLGRENNGYEDPSDWEEFNRYVRGRVSITRTQKEDSWGKENQCLYPELLMHFSFSLETLQLSKIQKTQDNA